jgi:cytochrome c biogenesis protein CcmG, thiol:disulfide interchange protein DsbE
MKPRRAGLAGRAPMDRILRPSSAFILGRVRRRILPTIAIVAGACLIGLLAYGVAAQSSNRTLDQALADGRQPAAPQATRALPVLSSAVPGLGDSLAAYHGHVVLLNFWASWCPPCQAEAPLLEQAQGHLLGNGGTVLGVTYRDVSGDSLSFVHEHHITYPNLRDSTGEFAHAYGTDRLPESFVIDRSGDIVAICRGEIDRAFVGQVVAFARESTWRPVAC